MLDCLFCYYKTYLVMKFIYMSTANFIIPLFWTLLFFCTLFGLCCFFRTLLLPALNTVVPFLDSGAPLCNPLEEHLFLCLLSWRKNGPTNKQDLLIFCWSSSSEIFSWCVSVQLYEKLSLIINNLIPGCLCTSGTKGLCA